MNDFTHVSQLDEALLTALLARTSELKKDITQAKDLSGKLMFNLFFEPSTRTRMSFAAAGHHLKLNVVNTENGTESTSAAKGESIEDAIKVLCEYRPDVIVMRHPEIGTADRAAKVSTVPVINAGDGGGQHPTQALLDLFTIKDKLGTLEGLTIALGVDLAHSRTARSLTQALCSFRGNTFIFVAPRGLEMGDDIKQAVRDSGNSFREVSDINDGIADADVVYWNRIQRERFDSDSSNVDDFTIDAKQLEIMKKDTIIMNPLPRIDEMTLAVDNDPRAVYFEQAGNGLYVRMALLEHCVVA